jgi:hypothetical protein
MATWDLDRLQRTLVARFAEYVDGFGQLAATGIMEPGEWVRDYAKLWSGVIGDVGEFLLGATPATDGIPTYSVEVAPGEAGTVRFVVPQAAFPAGAETVALSIDGLVKRGGARVLTAPRHMRLEPAVVSRLDRHSELKIFGLRDVVAQGEHYRGIVSTEPAGVPIAVLDVVIV